MLNLNIFYSKSSFRTDHCRIIKSNYLRDVAAILPQFRFLILQPVETKPERTFHNGITVTNLFTSKLDSLDSFDEDCFSQRISPRLKLLAENYNKKYIYIFIKSYKL